MLREVARETEERLMRRMGELEEQLARVEEGQERVIMGRIEEGQREDSREEEKCQVVSVCITEADMVEGQGEEEE